MTEKKISDRKMTVNEYARRAIDYEIICLEYSRAGKIGHGRTLKEMRKLMKAKKKAMLRAKADMEHSFREEAKHQVFLNFKERMSK